MNQVLLANSGANLPAGAVVVLCPVAANGTPVGVGNISQLQQKNFIVTQLPLDLVEEAVTKAGRQGGEAGGSYVVEFTIVTRLNKR